MTVIPAHQLAPHELARLGNNTAAAVRAERQSNQSSSNRTRCEETHDIESDEQIEAAMRSEHVAS